MIEWVLILTLVGSTSQSGQAIEQIPGFYSATDCKVAGNGWIKKMQDSGSEATIPRAICVKRPKYNPGDHHE